MTKIAKNDKNPDGATVSCLGRNSCQYFSVVTYLIIFPNSLDISLTGSGFVFLKVHIKKSSLIVKFLFFMKI